ncbi:MAG: hypothetical protein ACON5E_05105 [Flavobacteriales bacterium]
MKYLYTILITLLTYSLSFSQDTLYVIPEASYPNFPNISAALDSANSGDIILVSSGNYNEDLIISKAVTINPLIIESSYTISGDIQFSSGGSSSNDSGPLINSTIIGAIIYGGLSSVQTNCSYCGVFNLNFIDCIFYNSVNLKSTNIFFNSYYSIFYEKLTIRGFGDIIGNKFISSNAEKIEIWDGSQNYNFGGHEAKFFANSLENFKIFLRGGGAYNMPSSLNISNNYFNVSENFTNFYFFQFYDAYVSPVFINNNTFNINDNWESSGSLMYCYDQLELYLSFNNNIILSNTTDNTYENTLFSLDQELDFHFYNNIYNKNVSNFESCFKTGSGYALPNLIEENNYFVSDLNQNDIDSVGVCSSDYCLNKGVNLPEFRDINNTLNDLGTFGGPHSWSNYHNGSGPKVIDINIPSIIAPGMNISINGKGVNIND